MNVFPTEKLQERLDELEAEKLLQETYRFSDDEEFASKLKGFFSDRKFRRSGRTFLLARILVETGIESGESVKWFDHYNVHSRNSDMPPELHRVIAWYKERGINIKIEDVSSINQSLKFRLISGMHLYNLHRIVDYVPKVKEEERQFSKLLLIL